MKVRKGSIKTLGFFIIILTVSFGSISWFTLSELQARHDVYIKAVDSAEWALLRNSLALSLDKAKSDGEGIVQRIAEDIYGYYEYDFEKIVYELDNYHEPNNYIRTVITSELEGKYFNNIESDNTDPFVVRGHHVETDNSSNCATYGSSRPFEDEYKMHANPFLAEEAFKRIANADLENMNSAAIDRPIFFQFLDHPKGDLKTQTIYADLHKFTIPEDHVGKGAQILESYDIDGLEAYFRQTKSWQDTFRSFEFITPSYIFNREDLAGRPFIENGRRTEYDRLSVNVVFNFKNVIDHNPILKRDLVKFEIERQKVHRQFIQDERVVYLILILIISICTIGMRYTNKLATMEVQDGGPDGIQSRRD